MENVTIALPQELSHPAFFPNGQISWEKSDEDKFNPSAPFIYEAAFYTGKDSLKPWEEWKTSIPVLLHEWETIKQPLEEYFEKRKKEQAAVCMKRAAALFLEMLFWTNGQPVKLNPRIPYEELEWKPVNIEERLGFILARLNLYHSSVQLIELFKEMEKIYAKATAISEN